MMFVGFHGKEDFVSYFAIDIGRVIGISNDKRCAKFLCLHVVFFNQFPVNKAGIGTTVDEGMFLDAVLPLL